MMKHPAIAAGAMLLLGSCMQSPEVKPTPPPGPAAAASLATGTVTGIVLEPDGKPAAQATVLLLADGHWGGRDDYAKTNDAGKFAMEGVPLGKITLYAGEGFKAASLQLTFTKSGDAGTIQLKAPGSLSGTVTNKDGSPVTGGAVYFAVRGLSAPLPGGPGFAEFKGDHFQLDAITAGDLLLHVGQKASENGGSRAAHVPIHIEPGQHAEVAVQLETATSTVGINVVDAVTGKPLDATVLLLEADGTPEAYWKTDEAGGSAFSGRSEGDRILLVEKPGYTPQRVAVHVPAGKEVDAGKVALVVSDPAVVKRFADARAAEEKAAAEKAAAEKAEKLAKATISITSTSPDAVEAFKLGTDWFFAQHFSKATELWQKALSLDPNFLLAQSYLALSTPGTDSVKRAVAAADAGAALPEPERTELQSKAAIKQGDDAKGDELSNKLSALAPPDWRAQMTAGFLALQARKLDAATDAFQRAAVLNPGAFSPHSQLAGIADLRGDRDTEVAEYQKALAIRPGEASLQDDLVRALIAANKLDAAAAAADVELKMPGAGWETHVSLSVVGILRGDSAGAIKEARLAHDAAKDESDHYDTEEHILFLQLALKKHADALKTAAATEKEAQGKNPNYFVSAAIDRALVQIDQGKFAAAIASLTQAMEREESAGLSGVRHAFDRRLTLALLAWANASAGKAAEAQSAADTLVKEAGAQAASDSFLASLVALAQGEALLAKGDAAGAVAAMSKCTPESDVCLWALSAAQEKAGDKPGAETTRATLLALNHTDDWALWVRARIAPPRKPAAKATKAPAN